MWTSTRFMRGTRRDCCRSLLAGSVLVTMLGAASACERNSAPTGKSDPQPSTSTALPTAATEYTLVLTAAGNDLASAPARAEGVILIESSGKEGNWRLDFAALGVGADSEGRFVAERNSDGGLVVLLHPHVIDDDVVMHFPDGIAAQGTSQGTWEYRTDAGVEARGVAEVVPAAVAEESGGEGS